MGPWWGGSARTPRSVEPTEFRSGSPSQHEAEVSLLGLKHSSPNDEVMARLAKLEEQCAEHKASFDQMKSVMRRLEKLEALCDDRKEVETSIGTQRKLEKTLDSPDVRGGLDLDTPKGGCCDTSFQRKELPVPQDKLETLRLLPPVEDEQIDTEVATYEIELPESIYSDFVLTWARGKAWPTFTSTLLCVACITIQFSMSAIVFDFSHDEVSERMSSISLWAAQFESRTSGKVGGYTQEQYCEGAAWAWETDRIEMFVKYLQPHWFTGSFHVFIPSGLFLGGLSLMLWSAHCVAEGRDNLHFLALLSLPWPGGTASYVYNEQDSEGKLLSLGWGPRIAVSLIAVCRMGIILLLALYGLKFLIYTTDLLDFILNAVALTFVLDIDDLCFRFISLEKQRVLKTLAPPEMSGKTARIFGELTKGAEIITMLFVLIFTGVAVYAQHGFAEVMQQVGVNLCPTTLLHDIDEQALALGIRGHHHG